jgi:serine protease Do
MVISMLKKIFVTLFILSAQTAFAGTINKNSYADIVQPLIPAVVNISVESKSSPQSRGDSEMPEGMEEFRRFFEFFGQMPGVDEDEDGHGGRNMHKKAGAAGSGFIISADGYIVTNHHVVENAEKITVTLSNDQKYDAKLIGSDSRTDLALLKIESKTSLHYVKFGNSEESRVGDFVIAIGNPFGLGSTVTSGIISAQARDIHTNSGNIIDNFIQTDASINRGNSGGPMFNMNGEVIGINFAIFSPTGGSVGVGFAVPSSVAKPIIDQLMKHGKVHHGWLGVAIQSTEDVAEGLGIGEGVGALVSSITTGSPAEKAGIQVGDIILKFDGKEISSNRKLPRIVAETPVGKKVNVELMSNGKNKTISLTVGEVDGKMDVASAKDPKGSEVLGLGLTSLTPEMRQKLGLSDKASGVVITHVDRKSIIGKLGIRKGDLVSALNQQAVNTPEDFARIINEAKQKQRKSVMMQLYRTGRIIFLTIPIK